MNTAAKENNSNDKWVMVISENLRTKRVVNTGKLNNVFRHHLF